MTLDEQFLRESPLGAYRTSPKGEITFANKSLAAMLGYTSTQDLIGVNARSFYANIHDRKAWQELLNRQADSCLRNYEVQWRKRDGTVIWVSDTARVARQPMDGSAMHYEGIVSDISYSHRIRQEDPRMKVFDWAGVCWLRKDLSGKIVEVNSRFIEAEGKRRENLLGLTDVDLYGPEVGRLYQAVDREVIKSKQPKEVTELHQFGDGEKRKVHVIKTPYFQADQIVGIECFFWVESMGPNSILKALDEVGGKVAKSLEESETLILLTAFGDVDTKSQAEGVSPIAIIEKPASESRILRELDNAAREAAKDDRRREVARLNDERWELLRRKHSGTMLTMEEEKRLKKLEAVIEAFIESEYPLEAAAT